MRGEDKHSHCTCWGNVMKKNIVRIVGKEIIVQSMEIPIEKLILDEYNPRISLTRDTHVGTAYDKHLPQPVVALSLKTSASYLDLRANIRENKGVLLPIWVYPSDGKYIVVEGNTRLQIFKDLLKENPRATWFEKIPCKVLPKRLEERDLAFVRLTHHLHGHTDWDKYERAKYLYKLSSEELYPLKELHTWTKLSKGEIEQDLEAFKIIEKQYIPKYGATDKSYVHKFSYFKEYVKNRKLRELMEQLGLKDEDFCDWVGKKKLPRAQEVRNLKDILANEKTRRAFLKIGYESAMDELRLVSPEKSTKIYEKMKELTERIKKLPHTELEELWTGENKNKTRIILELKRELEVLLNSRGIRRGK